MRTRFSIFTIIGVIAFLLISQTTSVSAELLGSTITTQVSFNASEVVTAADIVISVAGGTIQSVSCGGDVFNDLGTSTGTRCVVFDTTGSTSGVIATVEVLADTLGTLTVSASGTLSTPGGGEPSTFEFIGGTYNITNTGSTSTPTPTVGNELPKSGIVENTLVIALMSMTSILIGFVALRRL